MYNLHIYCANFVHVNINKHWEMSMSAGLVPLPLTPAVRQSSSWEMLMFAGLVPLPSLPQLFARAPVGKC